MPERAPASASSTASRTRPGEHAPGHRRIGRPQELRRFETVALHQAGPRHLALRVAAHSEGLGARQQILGRPVFGDQPGQAELQRRERPEPVDAGVDSGHEALGHSPHPRTVARPLQVEVPAISGHETGETVALHPFGSQKLGQASLGLAAPQLHLEEAVLRLHEPLGEEEVVLAAGIDVRNAPAVADHLDLALEAGHGEAALDHGEHGPRPGAKVGGLVTRPERSRQDHEAKRQKGEARGPCEHHGAGIIEAARPLLGRV